MSEPHNEKIEFQGKSAYVKVKKKIFNIIYGTNCINSDKRYLSQIRVMLWNIYSKTKLTFLHYSFDIKADNIVQIDKHELTIKLAN